MDDFGQALIDKCVEGAKKHCGSHGFILLMVKSREDQQLLCATNLVPEISIPALHSAQVYLRQLDADAKEYIENINRLKDIDAPRLGDGD